jgi:hypothetical protein
MAEGYVDEHRLIRWGERHDIEDLAPPPQREPEEEEDDGDDADEEGETDDDYGRTGGRPMTRSVGRPPAALPLRTPSPCPQPAG